MSKWKYDFLEAAYTVKRSEKVKVYIFVGFFHNSD
jgi:hypothetical protein